MNNDEFGRLAYHSINITELGIKNGYICVVVQLIYLLAY